MATAVAPTGIHPRVAEFLDKPRKMLIDGKWVNAASGKTFPDLQSRDRRSPRPGRRRRQAGHRRRRKSRPQGLRQRSVVAHDRLRARPAGLEARRPARRAHRRIRDHRDPRQRQAAHRRARRRRSARRRHVPLHGWMGDQARRHDDSNFRSLHAGRDLSRLHVARAGRRRRPDHSVEFPAPDGRLETRSRARLPDAASSSSPPSKRRSPRCVWAI